MHSKNLSNNGFQNLLSIWLTASKLGLTCFGGPVAHIGYFHTEYVLRKKWINEEEFADLVALCQSIPGPASSQLGISIGTIRAGLTGGIVAWLGFTLPSFIIMVLFALFLNRVNVNNSAWMHGLKIVAVAIVAQAVLTMGQKLASDRIRASIAVAAMSIALLWQIAFSQVSIIIAACFAGLILFRKNGVPQFKKIELAVSPKIAIGCIILFFALLISLPLFRHLTGFHWIAVADSFYRTGALVFGGGHVVLPLLQKEVIPSGWITNENFLAGYGAAQALPGPLFTFTAYLGTMIGGISYAIICTSAIFLPGFLLIVGALPFWNALRQNARMQASLSGVNAAVVGILLAALYNPLWTSSIFSINDFVLAAVLFSLLVFWKTPPWIVVLAGLIAALIMQLH